jgi:hypothetical protein
VWNDERGASRQIVLPETLNANVIVGNRPSFTLSTILGTPVDAGTAPASFAGKRQPRKGQKGMANRDQDPLHPRMKIRLSL